MRGRITVTSGARFRLGFALAVLLGVSAAFGLQSLGVAGAAGQPLKAGPPSPSGQLTSTAATGRWIVDESGRAIVLHGVNLPIKVDGATALDAGFGRDDAEFLAANGLRTVRLIIQWASVEPDPGSIDEDYLDEVMQTYRILADAGIYVLLDMHQDMWGPKYGGNGHPEWANVDDDVPPEPNLGFPANYVAMPALWRAWDNFWANRSPAASPGQGLQDHYAAMWREVAARFAGDPHLVGYEVMNEPWPGSTWALCFTDRGCPEADQQLAAFDQKVADAIRTVDPDSMIWYEPFTPSAIGAFTNHPGLEDPHAGFTFHVYCFFGSGAFGDPENPDDETCSNREERGFDRMVNQHHQARDPDSALFLTEFGASKHYPEIERPIELADEFMVPWHYWAYCTYCQFLAQPGEGETAADGPALVMDMNRPPEGENIDTRKLDIMARPHPHAVAGTPLAWDFDRETRVFSLRYSTDRPDGTGDFAAGSVTEVFVPRRHYPSGYRAVAEGARVVRSNRDPQILRLSSTKGSGEVVLTLEPAPGA